MGSPDPRLFGDVEIPIGVLLQVRGWSWAHAEQYDGEDAYYEADRRLTSLGMTTGSMQFPQPTAAYRGAEYVSKWRGLSERERRMMDACILIDGRGEARRVWVLFREVPDAR